MAQEDIHPCARCASMQKTCCQRAEILVTRGDLARIAQHTGQSDFWNNRPPENAEYLEQDPDDPNWLAYTTNERGERRMLLRRPTGDCTFLGEAGCVLPLEVRPLVCRLYPFAYTESGIDGQDVEYCPTESLLPKDRPGVTMLTILGMDPADGERWRSALYRELREDHAARQGECQTERTHTCSSA